jgi:hypothetical protein
MISTTKSDVLDRLKLFKSKLEEMLTAHSESSLAEMAEGARPLLLAALKQATEHGKVEKSHAARLKRMLESPCATPSAVVKASRSHVEAGLDDGDRTERDDMLVRQLRKGIGDVDAAIAAIVTATGASLVTRKDRKGVPVQPTLTVYPDYKFGI